MPLNSTNTEIRSRFDPDATPPFVVGTAAGPPPRRKAGGVNGPAIIVVEDDADLREQVVAFLTLSGFAVTGVGAAVDLYRRMAVERFAVVILDLRLPDEDGLSIAAHVRTQPDVGIIMVTSRGMSEDRVRGFNAGADIYMPKPVDLRELAAAAHSLCRRLEQRRTASTAAAFGEPAVAPAVPAAADAAPPWRFDRAGFALTAPNGRSVRLTANEVALLERLTARPGVVVPRGELLAALGYDPLDPGNRNLDAAMRRLRLKAEEQTGEALPVRTVHAVGYQIGQDVVGVPEP